MSKKQFIFSTFLDIDERTEKQAAKLSIDVDSLRAKRPEMEKRMVAMRETIWLAYEASRKAQIVGSLDALALVEAFEKSVNIRDAFEAAFFREIEGKNSELSTVLVPVKTAAIELLSGQIPKVEAFYLYQGPSFRENVSGREMERSREDLITGRRYVEISTNGAAIIGAKKMLVFGKTKVMDATTLEGIRKALCEIEDSLNKIDFSSKKVEVDEEFLGRIDTDKPHEMMTIQAPMINTEKTARA